MADAKAENERIKRQKEEEEKRQALEESVRSIFGQVQGQGQKLV